jgi:AmiR/NasT family two-component response regulator
MMAFAALLRWLIIKNKSGLVMKENRLYPEDQARVDKFISEGVNATDRKPFKPLRLMLVLVIVVSSFSALSLLLGRLFDIS